MVDNSLNDYMDTIELSIDDIDNLKVSDLDYNINFSINSDSNSYMWSFCRINDTNVKVIAEELIRRKFFVEPKYISVSSYMEIFKSALSKWDIITIEHFDDQNEDDYNFIIFSFDVDCEYISNLYEVVIDIFEKLDFEINNMSTVLNNRIQELLFNLNSEESSIK